MAPATWNIPASKIQWPSSGWLQPLPAVSVKIAYEMLQDKTWLKPIIQINNLTDSPLKNVRVRYFYRGEGSTQVVSQPFYPSNASISINPDAGDVSFAEITLPDLIPAYGQAYWGQGPKFGLHRSKYEPWESLDDPSFESLAVPGVFVPTTKIAILNQTGQLLNQWSCYESGGKSLSAPKVRVVAKDLKYGSNQSSLIQAYVENVGTQTVRDFKLRYYFRESESKTTEYAIYYNPNAKDTLIHNGNNLNYLEFLYSSILLNPGEKTEGGNGLQLELHHPNWSTDWSAQDDPSHAGITSQWSEGLGFVVLDNWGNVLYGQIPSDGSQVQQITAPRPTNPGILRWTSDGLAVLIQTEGNYSLEVVNAAGIWQKTLRYGFWSLGEMIVPIPAGTLTTGQYVILRQGTLVLDRIQIP